MPLKRLAHQSIYGIKRRATKEELFFFSALFNDRFVNTNIHRHISQGARAVVDTYGVVIPTSRDMGCMEV